MPVLSSIPSLQAFLDHRDINNSVTNATGEALQVVCAWPVSGQYGPGSRVLYYVLVVACILARKIEWLRNACLAAALLLPAVAALHGIVLAAVHVPGAVDMDVYGAFQLCSIGILAGPVTVRLSQTYFNNDGRNIIFLWSSLLLAGLLSLIVEFYRSNAVECNEFGSPVPQSDFQYGTSNCSLRCTVEDGPTSPLRGGSANNIYVIESPTKLTFGTATLLAAACCVPAILSMVTMLFKVLESDYEQRFGKKDKDENSQRDEIDGINGATLGEMKKINTITTTFLRTALEAPVFSAAVLAILIIGERNFFSTPVRYQTEPIASIGQWAPIVGTGLAALGSLYLLLARDMKAVSDGEEPYASSRHCNCSHHHFGDERHPVLRLETREDYSPSSRGAGSLHSDIIESPPDGIETREGEETLRASTHAGDNDMRREASTSNEAVSNRLRRASTNDAGNRKKVAKTLTKIGNIIGAAAHDQFDDSEFKHGRALDFPEIPGEMFKNKALPQIREQYNTSDQTSPLRSFAGSIVSGIGVEATPLRMQSPQSPLSFASRTTFPAASTPRRAHSNTLPGDQGNPKPQFPHSDSAPTPRRRDTLGVPCSPVHGSLTRGDFSEK